MDAEPRRAIQSGRAKQSGQDKQAFWGHCSAIYHVFAHYHIYNPSKYIIAVPTYISIPSNAVNMLNETA